MITVSSKRTDSTTEYHAVINNYKEWIAETCGQLDKTIDIGRLSLKVKARFTLTVTGQALVGNIKDYLLLTTDKHKYQKMLIKAEDMITEL